MDDSAPTPTEVVYGNLLNAFRETDSTGQKDKAGQIDIAIMVLECLWPDDCKRWRKRFGGEASASQ